MSYYTTMRKNEYWENELNNKSPLPFAWYEEILEQPDIWECTKEKAFIQYYINADKEKQKEIYRKYSEYGPKITNGYLLAHNIIPLSGVS